jgi:hypothetical protein
MFDRRTGISEVSEWNRRRLEAHEVNPPASSSQADREVDHLMFRASDREIGDHEEHVGVVAVAHGSEA